MSYITNNLGTIVFSLLLLLLVALIVKSMIKDKKAGKSLCTHDCSSCGMGASCTKIRDLKEDLKKASRN